MKIAVFIKKTTLHKKYGGLETQNKVLCEELAKRGHQITVFSPRLDFEGETTEKNGVHYVFVDCDYYHYFLAKFKKDSWTKRSVETFEKYHAQENFDFVISQSSAAEGIIINKDKLNVRVLAISHGTAISELKTYFSNVSSIKDLYWALRNTQYVLRQYFGRQRRFVLGAAKVVAVSNAVKNSLVEETFVPEDKVFVIYNGINSQKFSIPRTKTNNELVDLIYVGRIDRSKGVFSLLEMVEDIKEENVKLSIIGNGKDSKELSETIKEKNLEEKVELVGGLKYEDVVKYLTNSDIFVFFSQRIEGFPMTLPEAMMCSLPVVATDRGGIKDAIEDGKTGYLIKAGDLDSFTKKVRKLVLDKELREKMGSEGRKKALNEFTISKMVDKYEKVFMEVIK